MFWDRFYELCCSKNKKPNPVGKELGISSAVLTKWKNGVSYPNGEILIKIAKYFNCSIDYLVGLTDHQNSHIREISSFDAEILDKLHSLPEDSQEEIIYILNYKYDKYKNSEKETSSPLNTDNKNNLLA